MKSDLMLMVFSYRTSRLGSYHLQKATPKFSAQMVIWKSVTRWFTKLINKNSSDDNKVESRGNSRKSKPAPLETIEEKKIKLDVRVKNEAEIVEPEPESNEVINR